MFSAKLTAHFCLNKNLNLVIKPCEGLRQLMRLKCQELSGWLSVSPPAWALVSSLFLAPVLLIYSPLRGNPNSSLCNQRVTTDLRSPMQNLSSIIAEIHPASSAICRPVCHSNQFSPAFNHCSQYWGLSAIHLFQPLRPFLPLMSLAASGKLVRCNCASCILCNCECWVVCYTILYIIHIHAL